MAPGKKTRLQKAKDSVYTITKDWDKKQMVVYTGLAIVTLFAVGNRFFKR